MKHPRFNWKVVVRVPCFSGNSCQCYTMSSLWLWFFWADWWEAENTKNFIKFYIWIIELKFLYYELYMYDQKLKRRLSTSGALCSGKMIDLDLRDGIGSSEKAENTITLKFQCLNIFLSTGSISFIKVLVDNFLSVKGSSNWNSVIFAKLTKFLWEAGNIEKHHCYDCFVDIQTNKFLKLLYDNTAQARLIQFYH